MRNEFHSRVTSIEKEDLGVSKGKLKSGKDASSWSDDAKQKLREEKNNFKVWQTTKADEDKNEYYLAKKASKQTVTITKDSASETLITRLKNAERNKEVFKIAKQRNKQAQGFKPNKYMNDVSGNLLISDNVINNRWYEYFQHLLKEEFPHEQPAPLPSVFGPIEDITPSEVKKAISGINNGKATGPDEIPAKLFKQASKAGVIWLTNLINQIIKSRKMPMYGGPEK